MSGILFLRTEMREELVEFYTEDVGADVWLEQDAGCTVLQYDNFLFGFCDGDDPDTDGMLTFVTEDREGVDDYYDRFEDRAQSPPADNDDFDVYQFFADDPEGRTMEFQTFLHPTDDV